MSFTDLIKGRTQKYIKRIPKPGGGYRYIYREHHGGGVANKEHFDAGAAFKLTFKGQVGHFHITAVEGDKLKVKHDELHGDDHPGIEITRDELAQLLSTEHAAALKENAKKKRDTATRLKTRAPNSLAAIAAEKRAKAAEAKVKDTPAPTEPQKNTHRAARLEELVSAASKGTGRRQAVKPRFRSIYENVREGKSLGLQDAEFFREYLTETFILLDKLKVPGLEPSDTYGKIEAYAKRKGIWTSEGSYDYHKRAPLLLVQSILENGPPLKDLKNKADMIRHIARELIVLETEPAASQPTEAPPPAASQPTEAPKPAPTEPTEAPTPATIKRQAVQSAAEEAQRLDAQEGEKRSAASIQADERLREKILELITAEYQDTQDVNTTDKPRPQWSVKEKELNFLLDKIETLEQHKKRTRSTTEAAQRVLRETARDSLIENMRSRIKTDTAQKRPPAQEQEPRPANFETMPESSTDYTREGVALSSKAKGALNKALGEAMLKGDAAKREELRARRDTEALFTGAPGVDTLLSEAIKGAKREETADGSEHSEASGELSTTEAEALDNAVESGHLIAHHNEGLTTYRASAERAAQTEGTTWRLAVRNGRYTLTLDDFTQGSTRLDPEQAPTEAEPAREPEKVDAVLSELEQLMKAHPHLANDPRLVGLLGSQADTAPKSEGAEAPLFITGIEGEERTQKARYRLMEAGDVIASHNPLSFMTREDYPEGIQERDYHQNKGEQLKVERNAAHLEPAYLLNTNPDATNGPPIITPQGVVLGGNSRAMSLQLAYGRGGEKGAKYKEQLTKQAAAFGFNAADIAALKAPVLVRVYEPKEQSREHLAKLVRTMNETKTQGLDSRIEGRALASKISTRTLETIAKGLAKAPDKYSLNRYLTKPSTGLTEVIRSLQKDKVITPENTPIYLRDDGTLSAAGREMIANALVGYVVRDEKVLKAMDYQTFENISTALGKLAGAGLGPAVTSALESAITIYDQAIRSDEITARGSIESRLEGVAHILDKQELFAGASAGDTDIEGHRRNVRENPLAGAFLQIFTMNKGSAQIEESLERFMELTKEKEQMDFFAAPPMEYEAAARKIVSELAEKHKVETRLYSDAEKERAESALL